MRVPFYLRANKEPQAVYAGLGFGGVCSKASGRAAEGSGNDPHDLIPIEMKVVPYLWRGDAPSADLDR